MLVTSSSEVLDSSLMISESSSKMSEGGSEGFGGWNGVGDLASTLTFDAMI